MNENEKSPERLPASYQGALDAAKTMHLAKVKDPWNPEDPKSQEARDTIDTWKHSANLHMGGIGSVEKAKDIVRFGRLWLEAGYTDPQILRGSLEYLEDEHMGALREGNAEVVKTLRDAIEDLENRLAVKNPKEKGSVILEAKIEDAKRLAEAGKVTDAVGILTLALLDPRFKRMSDEKKREIRVLRDTIKLRG